MQNHQAGTCRQALALSNYEAFYQLPTGSATLEQVARSAAGIDGWSEARIDGWQQAKEAALEVMDQQMLASTQASSSQDDFPHLPEHKLAPSVTASVPTINNAISVLVNSMGGETVEVRAHSGELVAHLRRRIAKSLDRPLTQLALAWGTNVLHGMQRFGEVVAGSVGQDDDSHVGEVVDRPQVHRVEISAFLSQEGGPVDELFDFDDAQGLAEYMPDLYMGLKSGEAKVKVCSNFLHRGPPHINAQMRAILVDWLLEVHLKYRLQPVTLFLAVNILDRYLQANTVDKRILQLVGAVSLMLAAKFEEINPPEMKDITYVCDNAFTMKDTLQMETKVITSLAFNLTVPTAAHFIDLYQRANRCDKKHCFVVQYLLELTLGEAGMIGELPSKVAAAATLLSNRLLSREACWPDAMSSYTGYGEAMLENVVQKMRQLLSSARTNNLQAVFRKFSRECFGSVATTLS